MFRDRFTFYESFFNTIDHLQTNKEKLQAYESLCRYAFRGIEPDVHDLKPGAAAVFLIAKPIIDMAEKRAKAGRLGGLATQANRANLPQQ